MGLQDQAGMDQQGFAVAGQRQGMGVADEEAPAQDGLELADMLADRGLGEVEPPARLAEARGCRRGDKGFQPLRMEHSSWLSDNSIAVNNISDLHDRRR